MREKDNAGKSMTIHIIPKLVSYAFPKAMTPENIISGYSVTGIYPFDGNVFTPDEFMATYATDRPFQEAQHDDVLFLAASSSSQTLLELLEETPVPSSTSITHSNSVVYPESIPHLGALTQERRIVRSEKRENLKYILIHQLKKGLKRN